MEIRPCNYSPGPFFFNTVLINAGLPRISFDFCNILLAVSAILDSRWFQRWFIFLRIQGSRVRGAIVRPREAVGRVGADLRGLEVDAGNGAAGAGAAPGHRRPRHSFARAGFGRTVKKNIRKKNNSKIGTTFTETETPWNHHLSYHSAFSWANSATIKVKWQLLRK